MSIARLRRLGRREGKARIAGFGKIFDLRPSLEYINIYIVYTLWSIPIESRVCKMGQQPGAAGAKSIRARAWGQRRQDRQHGGARRQAGYRGRREQATSTEIRFGPTRCRYNAKEPPPRARMGAPCWQRGLMIIARMPLIWCGSISIPRWATSRAVIAQRSC